jgi:hypothetical protein
MAMAVVLLGKFSGEERVIGLTVLRKASPITGQKADRHPLKPLCCLRQHLIEVPALPVIHLIGAVSTELGIQGKRPFPITIHPVQPLEERPHLVQGPIAGQTYIVNGSRHLDPPNRFDPLPPFLLALSKGRLVLLRVPIIQRGRSKCVSLITHFVNQCIQRYPVGHVSL